MVPADSHTSLRAAALHTRIGETNEGTAATGRDCLLAARSTSWSGNLSFFVPLAPCSGNSSSSHDAQASVWPHFITLHHSPHQSPVKFALLDAFSSLDTALIVGKSACCFTILTRPGAVAWSRSCMGGHAVSLCGALHRPSAGDTSQTKAAVHKQPFAAVKWM